MVAIVEVLLAAMDKDARLCRAQTTGINLALEKSAGIVPQITGILKRANAIRQEAPPLENFATYVLATCLKLLEVNFPQGDILGNPVDKVGVPPAVAAETLACLRELLHQKPLQQACCGVVATGFATFFPTAKEKTDLLQLLLKGQDAGPGLDVLRTTLFEELSETPLTSLITDATLLEELFESIAEFAFQSTLAELHRDSMTVFDAISPCNRFLLKLQAELLTDSKFSTLLRNYSLEIMTKAQHLLEYLLVQNKPGFSDTEAHVLRNSFLGTAVVSLVLGLSRKDFHSNSLGERLLDKVTMITQQLDQVNKKFHAAAEAEAAYISQISQTAEKMHVVESAHPYQAGLNQVKQTVTILGAKALTIRFSRKCRTAHQSNDILQIFKGDGVNDSVLNADGNPFFSDRNFPIQPLYVEGNTLTFIFSASSRPGSSHEARWGFKCTIENADAKMTTPVGFWMLELESSLAVLASKIIASLIEGVAPSTNEKALSEWLDCDLLSGGLEPTPQIDGFLREIIEGKNDLAAWVISLTGGSRQLPPSAQSALEDLERHLVAAMVKHCGLVLASKAALQQRDAVPADVSERLKEISVAVRAVAVRFLYRGTVHKEWLNILEDGPFDLESFVQRFLGNLERLQVLCEINDVEFDKDEERDTLERLFEALERQVKSNVEVHNF